VEGTYESFWWGFKDDVVARNDPERPDIRSISRVGVTSSSRNRRSPPRRASSAASNANTSAGRLTGAGVMNARIGRSRGTLEYEETIMELILIRHADALPLGQGGIMEDAARPLSELGQTQARALAAALDRSGTRLNVLLTSPAVRTRQTAEGLLASWKARPPRPTPSS